MSPERTLDPSIRKLAAKDEAVHSFVDDMNARQRVLELLASSEEIDSQTSAQWELVVRDVPVQGGIVQAREDMDREMRAARRDQVLATLAAAAGLFGPSLLDPSFAEHGLGLAFAATGLGARSWVFSKNLPVRAYGKAGESLAYYRRQSRRWTFDHVPHDQNPGLMYPTVQQFQEQLDVLTMRFNEKGIKNPGLYPPGALERTLVARHYSALSGKILAEAAQRNAFENSFRINKAVEWRDQMWQRAQKQAA